MLKAVVLSRKGEKSTRNEDACFASPGLGIFAVADGVGGNPDGEQASRQSVNLIQQSLSQGKINVELIQQSIQNANSSVYKLGGSVADGSGMACTIVLAWIHDETLHCFYVGDSRIYRLRNGVLQQLTQDHVKTVIKVDKTKNMVTRAIGLKAEVNIDVAQTDWISGDVLLLNSDGISDPLSDETITKIIMEPGVAMSDKAKMLIDESESLGGRDDKTVVLVF